MAPRIPFFSVTKGENPPGLTTPDPNVTSASDSQSLYSDSTSSRSSTPENRIDDNGPVGNGVSLQTPETSKFDNSVSELSHHCQVRGIEAKYTIGGYETRWSGSVKVGDKFFESSEEKTNKKEVKQDLAGVALKALKGTPVVPSSQGAGGSGTNGMSGDSGADQERNWIGDLFDLYVHELQKPVFEYETLYHKEIGNPLFACTVTLSSQPDEPFGSATEEYPSKKAAKFAAAKEAVQWLESSGEAATLASPTKIRKSKQPIGIVSEAGGASSHGSMNSVGSGTSSNTTSASTSASAAESTPNSSPGGSGDENGQMEGEGVEMKNRQLVDYLCRELGLTPPSYRCSRVVNEPELFDCFAAFKGEPRYLEPVGSVHGIFGPEKAKRLCARNVVQVLMKQKVECANQFIAVAAEFSH